MGEKVNEKSGVKESTNENMHRTQGKRHKSKAKVGQLGNSKAWPNNGADDNDITY